MTNVQGSVPQYTTQSDIEYPKPSAERPAGGGCSEEAALLHPLSEHAVVPPLTGLQGVPQAGGHAEQLAEVAHVQLTVVTWRHTATG